MKENPEEFTKGTEVIRIDEISRTVSGGPLPDEVKVTLNDKEYSYFDSTGDKPVKYTWEAPEK